MENITSEVKHHKHKCVMYFGLPVSLRSSDAIPNITMCAKMLFQISLGSSMENIKKFAYFMPSRYLRSAVYSIHK